MASHQGLLLETQLIDRVVQSLRPAGRNRFRVTHWQLGNLLLEKNGESGNSHQL